MRKKTSLFVIAAAIAFSACKTAGVPQDQKTEVNTSIAKTEASVAQDFNQQLPTDPSIKKGVLENGMTYYLHSTDVIENTASYYIIQNVGSILENDDQQGLAHFLEHMAFNGTETFPGKDMLNTLQENGLVFGRDINAYTSFDETVYNVNNLPTTPEMTTTGLQILKDWSNYLLLTDEEIDAERGVIKEEWRTGQSGRRRVSEATFNTLFGNSKYGKRLPIGLMDIVDNFEYKALRDFYHDWYRTDLQAIAIVGDIDVAAMETQIKEMFSSIPAVENAPERFEIEIEDNAEPNYDIAMDKEVATSAIAFSIRHPKPDTRNTVAYFKDGIYDEFITSMLNKRYVELSQKADAPFIYAQSGAQGMSRLNDSFGLYVGPKPNMQEEAFTAAMNELVRMVKFGFTQSEIDRQMSQIKSSFEDAIASVNDRPHGQIIGMIQSNYLQNEPIVPVAKEYELVKEILKGMTNETLLERIKFLYSKENRTVIVTGVAGNKNLTKEKALAVINAAENNTNLSAKEEEAALQSLMTGVTIVPGKIVSETKNEALGFTTYTLSNGIQVNYKYVDKNKNEITLEAISDGGKSLLKNSQLTSADFIGFTSQMSGLGVFSSTDLQKVLSGKQAGASFSIGETIENISGYSNAKDIETLMQLVNLHFTSPRFNEDGFALMNQNMENYLLRKSQDLSAKMQDSITTTLYGKNHPTKRIFDKKYVEEMDLEVMKTIYNDRFANPADFKFFIVGDLQADTLKPLLETYVASLPTTDKMENWKDNSVSWQENNIKREFIMPMEDAKGTVNISLKKEMPYSLKDKFLLKALGDILDLRYTATLREEEGGTYGASARASLVKEPKSEGRLSVNFDCNPALTDKLVSIVYREIDKIKNGEIAQEDLDKTITNMLKDRIDSKNNNGYDLSAIKNFVLEGYNMALPENFENIVKSISKESIQDIAKRLTTDGQSYEIVFTPQK